MSVCHFVNCQSVRVTERGRFGAVLAPKREGNARKTGKWESTPGSVVGKHSRLSPLLLADEERESVDVLKRNTGTLCHAKQRVLGDVELDTDFVGQTFVKAANQRTAAGKIDTVLDDVGV